MGFIRVRHAAGPTHEFDISEATYKRNKSAYKVVSKQPVSSPRPVKIVQAKPAMRAADAAESEE